MSSGTRSSRRTIDGTGKSPPPKQCRPIRMQWRRREHDSSKSPSWPVQFLSHNHNNSRDGFSIPTRSKPLEKSHTLPPPAHHPPARPFPPSSPMCSPRRRQHEHVPAHICADACPNAQYRRCSTISGRTAGCKSARGQSKGGNTEPEEKEGGGTRDGCTARH